MHHLYVKDQVKGDGQPTIAHCCAKQKRRWADIVGAGDGRCTGMYKCRGRQEAGSDNRTSNLLSAKLTKLPGEICWSG